VAFGTRVSKALQCVTVLPIWLAWTVGCLEGKAAKSILPESTNRQVAEAIGMAARANPHNEWGEQCRGQSTMRVLSMISGAA
jgi:hypothetical protein